MPVPLPREGEELLTPPSPAEITQIWRALVQAVGGGPLGLTPLQDLLLRSVTAALTGAEDLPPPRPITPTEFAQSLERRNIAFRERVCQVMALGALVRRPPDPAAMRRVYEFCEELSISGQLLELTASYADGGFDLAVADFDRLGHLGTTLPPDLLAGPGGTGASREGDSREAVSPLRDSVWVPQESDAVLARRWADLGGLPRGTIGRGVHDFYRARGFAFPGLPGSAPPLLAQHDWVHVLADYGTALESELEVFGYIARANDDPRAFSLLAMVVSLFETGAVRHAMGLFDADPGHLEQSGMAQRLADAMRRGALTAGSQDFMTLDWFALADMPLDVLRRELAVPEKSARAVDLGSAGPWEPGGISPYQLAAGRRAAEREDRDYDEPTTPE
jgi:hypothetical protein